MLLSIWQPLRMLRGKKSARFFAEIRRANFEGSRSLALASARAGVRRFVYISSVHVNGQHTSNRPFTEDDAVNPTSVYALSKWETEQLLFSISKETGMEVVVLRPPLVYGPGVKGNFRKLISAISRGFPLPLGCVNSLRSIVFVGNLADAIL